MLRILSIGNSFSVDAHTFVPQLFEAGGAGEVLLGNLYIGGCSLQRHLDNARTGTADYTYYRNNVSMGAARMDTGLLDEPWDYITFQQASHFSGQWETYEPYLAPLAEHVRAKCPRARFLIHQTWAYETDSTHPGFAAYGQDQLTMYQALKDCYARAAQAIGAQVIPCGDAMQIARSTPEFDHARGGESLNRDGFHLGLRTGRLLAGLTWYEFFTGRDARENPFVPVALEYLGMKDGAPVVGAIPGTAPTPSQLQVIRESAHAAVIAMK